jgi:pimeloyl-ACP methyl ester carboxylesterase
MTEFSLFSDLVDPATLGSLSRMQRLTTLVATSLVAQIEEGRFWAGKQVGWGFGDDTEAASVAASVAQTVREYSDLVYPFPVKTASLLVQGMMCDIAYVDERVEAPTPAPAPTLVFVHGLGSYLPAWRYVIEALRPHYRCIALDLPGFGRSAKSPFRLPDSSTNASTSADSRRGSSDSEFPISMAFYADVVMALLEALGVEHCVLCGHSMGGQIAFTAALREAQQRTEKQLEQLEQLAKENTNQKRIAAIVAVNSAGLERFSERDLAVLRSAALRSSVADALPAEVRATYKLNFYEMPAAAEQMIAERLALRGARDFPHYCAVQRASVLAMIDAQVREKLPALRQPVLVVFGANDALIPNPMLHGGTPLDVVRDAEKLIPACQTVLIPRCGHFAPFENPSAVSGAIRDFVDNNFTNKAADDNDNDDDDYYAY